MRRFQALIMSSGDSADTECLCLSRLGVKDIPARVLLTCTLTSLYLDGNDIAHVPGCLFTSLSRLLWLDLRNNHISHLPAEIGQHRCLETLLLEGNPITHLPLELGNVLTLRGLNLRRCPITFPPQEVTCRGLQSILSFLRSHMSKPETTCVDKLSLSSLDVSDEASAPAELERFEELKRCMAQMERADVGFVSSAVPQCAAEERREQSRINKHLLKEWRLQARATRQRKASQEKTTGQPPYATHLEHVDRSEGQDSVAVKQEKHAHTPSTDLEEKSMARDRELQLRIKALSQKMEENRRRNRRPVHMEIEAAAQDMEEVLKLQGEVAESRQELEYRLTAFNTELPARILRR